MNASFNGSFIDLIKNETTFVVDTITNVQSGLNRNSQPTDQRPFVPSIELPVIIHICCCYFVVLVVLLIIVTKRKYSKVIKVFSTSI